MTNPQRFRLELGRSAVAGSRQGPKHPQNEDSFALVEPEAEEVLGTYGCLYIVADGVGGHSDGEVASALAVETVRHGYYAGTRATAAENLAAAIDEANVRVHASAATGSDPDHGMATTIVAAAVLRGQIVVANVGDSRAYIAGDGRLQQLSHDHSWVQEALDRGRLTPEEARQSTRRNIITRALGLGDQVEADVRTERAPQQHTRLVLCTDGVHGVLDDDELRQIVEGMPPQTAVARILSVVETRRGHDDATVIVVGIRGPLHQEGERGTGTGLLSRLSRRFRAR